MLTKEMVTEPELAALAKAARLGAGRTKAEAARELGVAAPTVFNAEERPELSLTRLRIRMIEHYSDRRVAGPLFRLSRASRGSRAA
ncbi:MAG: hypothetical protein ACKVYV_11095 [Limisphaerales bacterium]